MDLLGVIAHYIDSSYCHQTVLLALTPTYGSHTGENLSDRLVHVINDYEITKSIGYFIADSASNNDRAIDLLAANILPINPLRQRLRCAAHIINLVCTTILFGVDTDCIEDACSDQTDEVNKEEPLIDGSGHLINEKTALQAWRKKGPVGKLHNLMIHIKGSPARRQFFESKQKEVDPELPAYKIVINGGIRWNSTHDMIERALQLKDAIEL